MPNDHGVRDDSDVSQDVPACQRNIRASVNKAAPVRAKKDKWLVRSYEAKQEASKEEENKESWAFDF